MVGRWCECLIKRSAIRSWAPRWASGSLWGAGACKSCWNNQQLHKLPQFMHQFPSHPFSAGSPAIRPFSIQPQLRGDRQTYFHVHKSIKQISRTVFCRCLSRGAKKEEKSSKESAIEGANGTWKRGIGGKDKYTNSISPFGADTFSTERYVGC